MNWFAGLILLDHWKRFDSPERLQLPCGAKRLVSRQTSQAAPAHWIVTVRKSPTHDIEEYRITSGPIGIRPEHTRSSECAGRC